MDDTSTECGEKIREMIRMKTPLERIKMGCSMHATSRHLVLRFIIENNPQISNEALRQELFLKFYGNDIDPRQQELIIRHLGQFSNEKVRF